MYRKAYSECKSNTEICRTGLEGNDLEWYSWSLTWYLSTWFYFAALSKDRWHKMLADSLDTEPEPDSNLVCVGLLAMTASWS